MADYRKLFQDELLKANEGSDVQKDYEQQIMRSSRPSNAGTLGLIDHFTGTNFAAQEPKQESMKEKLGQLLQMRQGQQQQKLSGLQALAKMQADSEDRSYDRDLKNKMFGLQLQKARDKAMAGPKLGADEKAKLGFANEVVGGVRGLREKIKAGMGISPDFWANNIHDNEVNNIRRAIAENYGRFQSGGAISGDEEKRFGHLIGSWNDNPELILKKLDALESEMSNKAALYGGNGMSGGGRVPSMSGGINPMDYDSMSDDELYTRFMSHPQLGGKQ